jgi:hypothetical protein
MGFHGLLRAFLICTLCSCLTGNTLVRLHDLLGDSFTFLYGDGVRTSQETHLHAFTTCYEDSFTFLDVDRVRTSQETPTCLHGLLRG